MKRVREWEKRRSNAAMDVLVNSLLVFSFLFHAFIKIHGVILLSSLGLGIRTWERPGSDPRARALLSCGIAARLMRPGAMANANADVCLDEMEIMRVTARTHDVSRFFSFHELDKRPVC